MVLFNHILNKHNNTYYAYETEYVFDETKQRKVQRRRCIGKYDPETNKIIPTGKRGRPPREWPDSVMAGTMDNEQLNPELFERLSKLSSRFQIIESMVSRLSSELNSARQEYDELMQRFSK